MPGFARVLWPSSLTRLRPLPHCLSLRFKRCPQADEESSQAPGQGQGQEQPREGRDRAGPHHDHWNLCRSDGLWRVPGAAPQDPEETRRKGGEEAREEDDVRREEGPAKGQKGGASREEGPSQEDQPDQKGRGRRKRGWICAPGPRCGRGRGRGGDQQEEEEQGGQEGGRSCWIAGRQDTASGNREREARHLNHHLSSNFITHPSFFFIFTKVILCSPALGCFWRARTQRTLALCVPCNSLPSVPPEIDLGDFATARPKLDQKYLKNVSTCQAWTFLSITYKSGANPPPGMCTSRPRFPWCGATKTLQHSAPPTAPSSSNDHGRDIASARTASLRTENTARTVARHDE